jgi:general stress protein 26
MGESAKKKHLHELLEAFDTAMFVTRHGDHLHARPMAVAAVDGANCVWLATSLASPKAAEIRSNARVSATFQSRNRYVALSGSAELVTDRAKIHALWKEAWRAWFPQGKDDPQLALIRVDVDDAEFWDDAGAKGVRHVFEAVKALASRERPAPTPGEHGRVKSSDPS